MKRLVVVLGSSSARRRRKAIALIESFAKNCCTRFHLALLRKPFCDTVLEVLESRRGRPVLFSTLVSRDKQLQRDIEDKLLFLVQLWYDTFMLHEDEFREIIGVYKQLRKEGVVFPQREPAHQFLINFEGSKSPIFEAVEQDRIYEEPAKTLTPGKLYRVTPDDVVARDGRERRPPLHGYGELSPPELGAAEQTLFHFEELVAAASEAGQLRDPLFGDLRKSVAAFADKAKALIAAQAVGPAHEQRAKELYTRAREALHSFDTRREALELNLGTAKRHTAVDAEPLNLIDEAGPALPPTPRRESAQAAADLSLLDLHVRAPSKEADTPADVDLLDDFFAAALSR